MVHILKFGRTNLRVGFLEGDMLNRFLIVSSIVIVAVYVLGYLGLFSIFLFVLFSFRVNDDYLDQYLFKKIKGEIRVELDLLTNRYVLYEIFTDSYGFSDFQDMDIIQRFTNLISSFKSDFLIIRYPYKIPVEEFKTSNEGYNSLFNNSDYIGEAYFVAVQTNFSDDFEKKASVSGLSIRKLDEEEVKKLDELL